MPNPNKPSGGKNDIKEHVQRTLEKLPAGTMGIFKKMAGEERKAIFRLIMKNPEEYTPDVLMRDLKEMHLKQQFFNALMAGRYDMAAKIRDKYDSRIDFSDEMKRIFLKKFREGEMGTCYKIALILGGDYLKKCTDEESKDALSQGYMLCVREGRAEEASEIQMSHLGEGIDFSELAKIAVAEPLFQEGGNGKNNDMGIFDSADRFDENYVTDRFDIPEEIVMRERRISAEKESFIYNLANADINKLDNFLRDFFDIEFTKNERFKKAVIKGYLKARSDGDDVTAEKILNQIGEGLDLLSEFEIEYLSYLSKGYVDGIALIPSDFINRMKIDEDQLKNAIRLGYRASVLEFRESDALAIADMFSSYDFAGLCSVDAELGRDSILRKRADSDLGEIEDESESDETVRVENLFVSHLRAGDVKSAKALLESDDHIKINICDIQDFQDIVKRGYYNALLQGRITDADDIKEEYGNGLDLSDVAISVLLQFIRNCDKFIEYLFGRFPENSIDSQELLSAVQEGRSKVSKARWEDYKKLLKRVIPSRSADFDGLKNINCFSHDISADNLLYSQEGDLISISKITAMSDVLCANLVLARIGEDDKEDATRADDTLNRFTASIKAGRIAEAISIYDSERDNVDFCGIPFCAAAIEEAFLVSLREGNLDSFLDMRQKFQSVKIKRATGFGEAVTLGAEKFKKVFLDALLHGDVKKAKVIFKDLSFYIDFSNEVKKAYLDYLAKGRIKVCYRITGMFGGDIVFSETDELAYKLAVEQGYANCAEEDKGEFERHFQDIINLPQLASSDEKAPEQPVFVLEPDMKKEVMDITYIKEIRKLFYNCLLNRDFQGARDFLGLTDFYSETESALIKLLDENDKKNCHRLLDNIPKETEQVFIGFLRDGNFYYADKFRKIFKGKIDLLRNTACREAATEGVLKSLEAGRIYNTLDMHKTFVKGDMLRIDDYNITAINGFYGLLIDGDIKGASAFRKKFCRSIDVRPYIAKSYDYCIKNQLTDTAVKISMKFGGEVDV